MKTIIAAALAVSFAVPAWAQVFTMQQDIHCSYDWVDFEQVYGKLKPAIDPKVNRNGYGFIYAENDEFDVVMFVLPDGGAFCVAWDSVKLGDPA